MTAHDESEAEHTPPVVRLFSGWADSPIWFQGPVPYRESRLDHDLVADLRAWDDGYYAALRRDYEWHDPDDAARYHRAGEGLARRLAEQIGHDFQVEYDVGDALRHVRAPGSALNRAAAAAFHELVERVRAEQAQRREVVDRARSEGHALHWSAYPPPHDQESPTEFD